MTTAGGTICPYCGVLIPVGRAHLCPIITTSGGLDVNELQHEVVDLVRSLDAATKRIAELERALVMACEEIDMRRSVAWHSPEWIYDLPTHFIERARKEIQP